MPGIFGYYGKKNNDDLALKMKSLLSHGEDWFIDSIFYHSFGFHGTSDFQTNLANKCISLSGKAIIIYGSIYSFKNQKLNNNIAKNLLKLYETYKLDLFKYLNGSYVLSIYDKGRMIIANDRMGSKNLYYFMNSEKILYSSEIKGILADKSIEPFVNYEAIAEFFNFRFLLGDKTFFKDIRILAPGSIIIVNSDKIQFKTYYSLKLNMEQTTRKSQSLNVLLKNFSFVMEKSIKKRIEAKNKIGIFLSGGLDSRLIAGFAKKVADETGKDLISFTFGTKGGWQEKIAKKVSKKLKITNEFYETHSDSVEKFAEEIVYKGDGDISIEDAHFISHLRTIRSKVDIVLVGLFCSELFGETLGVNELKISSKRELINLLYNGYYSRYSSHSLPFSNDFPLNIEEVIMKNLIHTVEEIPLSSYDQMAHYWEIMQRDRRFILPLSNHMCWYLETRLPFLDNDVIDFAFQLPSELIVKKRFIHAASRKIFPILANIPWEKEKSNVPLHVKGLLRRFYLEKKLFHNRTKILIQKVSLGHILFRSKDYRAYDYFLRTKSKKYLIDILIKKIDANFLNHETVRKIIKEHIDLQKDHTHLIIKLLQFELLNKIFFKK